MKVYIISHLEEVADYYDGSVSHGTEIDGVVENEQIAKNFIEKMKEIYGVPGRFYGYKEYELGELEWQ